MAWPAVSVHPRGYVAVGHLNFRQGSAATCNVLFLAESYWAARWVRERFPEAGRPPPTMVI
jgi:hypothetical protein